MSTFAVYNLHDDIKAHNLFAMQSDEDVFSDVYTGVTARVKVESARWTEEYRGPKMLHRPYMEVIGTVSSVFFEQDDQRIFPCGARELNMKDISKTQVTGVAPDFPQKVRIRWVLRYDEYAYAGEHGLFSDSGDFSVPVNLVGNVAEFPVDVRYMGVYETPIAGIEILHADKLYTCTNENHYEGVFCACTESKQIEAERSGNYEYYTHYSYEAEQQAVYADQIENEATVEEETELTMQAEQEIEEDMANRTAVQKLIDEHTNALAQRRSDAESRISDRKEVTERIRAHLEERARKKRNEREASISDAIFGVEGEDTRDVAPEKITYSDIKEVVQSIDKEKAKANEEAKKQVEDLRRVDRVNDNKLLNEGIDDVAGFTSADEGSASDQSGFVRSDEFGMPVDNSSVLIQDQLQDAKDKKSGKSQIQAARMADVAADNKALNEGETDIAGQGAAKAEKTREQTKSAQELVSSILGSDAPSSGASRPSAPSDDQQYL